MATININVDGKIKEQAKKLLIFLERILQMLSICY